MFCFSRLALHDTSSKWGGNGNVLSIVLLLPPAPAARVLDGLALATLSALSAAALRRIAVFGPPGGVGDDGRAVVEPTDGEAPGEEAPGEDWADEISFAKSCENPHVCGCPL